MEELDIMVNDFMNYLDDVKTGVWQQTLKEKEEK